MRFLIFIFCVLLSLSSFAKKEKKLNFQALTGNSFKKSDKQKWDQKYSKKSYVFGKRPASFLAENHKYIPSRSKILDMGMGEGRNAVFLAKQGHKVTGVDQSSVAIRKARLLAREQGVRIDAIVASLHEFQAPPKSFDAIICYYFVDRKLNKKIMKWLKPGGILIYEAYTMNQRKVRGFERFNKEFMLNPGELLTMFKSGKVLKYEEPLHLKNYRASIILKK